jgi:hypothetical protein
MSDGRLILRELRCPSCGGQGAYRGADSCATCGTALVSLPVDDIDGPPEPVFVYRRWVMVVLAISAVAFPFLPIPFLDGPMGFLMKLSVSGAIVKIMLDYRESMRS